MKLFRALTVAALAAQAAALSIGGKNMIVERDSDGLQDLVSCTPKSKENSTKFDAPGSHILSRLRTMSTHC